MKEQHSRNSLLLAFKFLCFCFDCRDACELAIQSRVARARSLADLAACVFLKKSPKPLGIHAANAADCNQGTQPRTQADSSPHPRPSFSAFIRPAHQAQVESPRFPNLHSHGLLAMKGAMASCLAKGQVLRGRYVSKPASGP